MLYAVLFKNYRTDALGLLIFKGEEEAVENLQKLIHLWCEVELGKMTEHIYRSFASRIYSNPYALVEEVSEKGISDKMKVICKVFRDGKVIDGITEVNVINPQKFVVLYAYEGMEETSIEHKQIVKALNT
jgi:hypothetical protein